MSWKSLLSAGFVVCVLTSTVFAVPSIVVKNLPYSAANGTQLWEVQITQNDAAYAGSLSVELPMSLAGAAHATRPFTVSVNGTGGDDTNGTATTTWYYNQTGSGGADPLLWNITDATPADHTQNAGSNPYATPANSFTSGLFLDPANPRLFAALGSTVALPDADGVTAGKQVNVLHIAASDGIFSWANAIVGENGVQNTGISGSKSSILRADMNGDGLVNGLDVNPFVSVLTDLAAYQALFPGLDGVGRGNINSDVDANGLDVNPFVACVTGGGCAPGAGSGASLGGGSSVPEPTSAVLVVLAGLGLAVGRRVRR